MHTKWTKCLCQWPFFSFIVRNQNVQCDTGTGRTLYRRSINARKRHEENQAAHCICSKHNQCLAGRCRRLEEITRKTIQLLIHHCAPHDRYSMPRPALDIQYITAARHDSIFPYTDRSTANMGINAGKAAGLSPPASMAVRLGGPRFNLFIPACHSHHGCANEKILSDIWANWWDLWKKKSLGVKCLFRLLLRAVPLWQQQQSWRWIVGTNKDERSRVCRSGRWKYCCIWIFWWRDDCKMTSLSTARAQMAVGHCAVFEELPVKLWLIWKEKGPLKKAPLPLRPWLWMTFFFAVA